MWACWVINQTFVKLLFTPLVSVCISWEGTTLSALIHVSSRGSRKNPLWCCLTLIAYAGFLTTWKDVRCPAGSTPHQMATRRIVTQSCKRSYRHTPHSFCINPYVLCMFCSWCRQAVRTDLQACRLSFLRSLGRARQGWDAVFQHHLQRRVCGRTVSGACA